MRNSALLAFTVSGLVLSVLLLCSTPQNPYDNLDNVKVTFDIPAGHAVDTSWALGDTTAFGLGILLVDKVDSIYVTWGEGGTDTIRVTPQIVDSQRVNVAHLFSTPGQKSVVVKTFASGHSKTFVVQITIKCTVPSMSMLLARSASQVANSNYFLAARNGAGSVPKYQWFKGNLAISSATSDTLWFKPLALSDSGYYYCTIANPCGVAVSDTDTIRFSGTTPGDSTANDHMPPTLKLISPIDSSVVSDSTVVLRLYARDANGISQVAVGLVPGTLGAADTFSATIKLLRGWNAVVITATDNSVNANRSIDTVVYKYDPTITDNTPPTLRVKDPVGDSSTTNASSRTVSIVAHDQSNIQKVQMTLGGALFNATQSDDSTWSVVVSNLQQNVFNAITIGVWDNSSNHNITRDTVYVKFDPTALDSTGPTIAWVSGPKSGTRITDGKITSVYDISDPSGISSAFWTLNGGGGGSLTKISTTQYQLADSLKTYNSNRLVIYAVDNSTRLNKDSIIVTLSYNPMPSSVSIISPVDGATGVENIGGVTLKWHKSTDPDGNPIAYVVSCGTSASTLVAHIVADTSYTVPNLVGATNYSWAVSVATSLDTVRSPALSNAFYTFATKNHPAVVTSFPNISAAIGHQVTQTISATDPEGIASYQWDLSSFGAGTQVTAVGTLNYIAPSSVGVYKVIVSIVDSLGGTTKDTATLTTTNKRPVITAIRRDTTIFINDSLQMGATAIDSDGVIDSIAWDFNGDGTFEYTSRPGTASVIINPGHRYPVAGTFHAALRVKDDNGNVTLDTVNIVVGKWIAVGGAFVSSDVASSTHLAIASDGTPYVCYIQTQNGRNYVSTLAFVNNAWSPIGAVLSTGYAQYLDFAVDNTTPYVAYYNTAVGYVQKWTIGSWADVAASTPGGGGGSDFALAVEAGAPFFSCVNRTYPFSSCVSTISAGTWTVLGSCFTVPNPPISLTVHNGTPYFASQNVVEAYTTIYDGSKAWIQVGDSVSTAGSFNFVSGVLYTAYGDATNKIVVKRLGSIWQVVGASNISGGAASNLKIAALNGNPAIAFIDSMSANKVSAMQYVGNAWTRVGQPGFSTGTPSDLAFATYNGQPYVAFSDGANGGKITVMTFK